MLDLHNLTVNPTVVVLMEELQEFEANPRHEGVMGNRFDGQASVHVLFGKRQRSRLKVKLRFASENNNIVPFRRQ